MAHFGLQLTSICSNKTTSPPIKSSLICPFIHSSNPQHKRNFLLSPLMRLLFDSAKCNNKSSSLLFFAFIKTNFFTAGWFILVIDHHMSRLHERWKQFSHTQIFPNYNLLMVHLIYSSFNNASQIESLIRIFFSLLLSPILSHLVNC